VTLDPAEELEQLALFGLPDADSVVQNCQHNFILLDVRSEQAVELVSSLGNFFVRGTFFYPILKDVCLIEITSYFSEVRKSRA